jgi:hypothetical protein
MYPAFHTESLSQTSPRHNFSSERNPFLSPPNIELSSRPETPTQGPRRKEAHRNRRNPGGLLQRFVRSIPTMPYASSLTAFSLYLMSTCVPTSLTVKCPIVDGLSSSNLRFSLIVRSPPCKGHLHFHIWRYGLKYHSIFLYYVQKLS